MHITQPAQVPYTTAQCEESVDIGCGGAGQSRTIAISEKQLRLLARAMLVLQGKEDGMQFTPIESAMLVDIGEMCTDAAEDQGRAVHGFCL